MSKFGAYGEPEPNPSRVAPAGCEPVYLSFLIYTGCDDFALFDETDPREDYLEILTVPLLATGRYEKREMAQADPFMTWFGLDAAAVLEAKARAGLVTSIYRQIGLGCERLLVRLIRDKFGVEREDCTWSQVVEGQKRSLDACIRFSDVHERKDQLWNWVQSACSPPCDQGVVFEVRQGHKSGDSKRQLGDKKNAAKALAEGLLPVMLVFSTQLPKATHQRYQKDGWLVLTGRVGGGPLRSTYAFFQEIVGFDLAGFLEDHQKELQTIVLNLIGRATSYPPP